MKTEPVDNWQNYYEHEEVKDLTELTPRLELRYRDIKYIKEFEPSLLKELKKMNPNQRNNIENIVCDLCLVVKGVDNKTKYQIIQSTMTTDIEACSSFKHPWRIEQDLFNLMFELKLSAYCSFQQQYKKIEFPDTNLLANGIVKKLNKNKLN